MQYAASQFTPFWFSSNDLPGRDDIAVAACPRVNGAGSMRWAALMLMGAIGAATATPSHAGTPSQGMPTCDEFSDKWEPSELPQTMLAAMAFAQEKVAAKDCVEKQDIATACRHWAGMLGIIDKAPALEYSRGDIQELITKNDCAAKAPESDPGPAQ